MAKVRGVVLGHRIGGSSAEVARAAHGLLVGCRERVRIQRPEEVRHHSVPPLLGLGRQLAVPGLNPVLLESDRSRHLQQKRISGLEKIKSLFFEQIEFRRLREPGAFNF